MAWKEAPRGTCDGWNNNPRKEIACYAVQRWFLDPADYVVPTIALRAIPLGLYRRVAPEATPTIDGDRVYLVTNRSEVVCLDVDGVVLRRQLDPLALFNSFINAWRQPPAAVALLAGMGL